MDEGFLVSMSLVGHIVAVGADPRTAGAAAAAMLDGADPRRRRTVAAEMDRLASQIVGSLVTHGWTPTDLAEILRRRSAATYLPQLASVLSTHTAQFDPGRVAPAWRVQLAELGPPAAADPAQPEGLARLLALTGALDGLPPIPEVIPPPGRDRTGGAAGAPADVTESDAKQLARVRALLAKAESTTYDAEAEAFTAKAQELITRHALQRLLDRVDGGEQPAAVTVRRLWIDAPYVVAKAMLVDAVGGANRCRTVISDQLGFCTVLGEPRDLDAVELLATSLLVQANAAMLRHGRQADRTGTSRTRSFRQSFLVSYAGRIGERLRTTGAAAAGEAAPAERLLPVLRAAEEAVQAEFSRLFPETTYKSTAISDARGWAAGRAAADLALLDTYGQVAGGVG